MRAHVIEKGTVINTIVVESLDDYPELVDGSTGGIGWKYKNGRLEPPIPPPLTKEDRFSELATLRYEKEIAGIKWNGHEIHTDDRSQVKLEGTMLKLITNTRKENAKWKFKDGFLPVSNENMMKMCLAVGEYIQKCYDRELELQEEIEKNVETDISTGWPTAVY